MKAILLVRIFISIFCYQTVYATSDSMSGTYTMPSNGTMTIDGIKYHGQPGLNFTPDFKVLSIENSTWYMINSTGSLSKIHFGVQDHGMVPYTRLLDGNIHRGLTNFPEVTFNLYFGLCKNRVDTSCNFMKNIESYSDHLVFLDGHHDTIHLVR